MGKNKDKQISKRMEYCLGKAMSMCDSGHGLDFKSALELHNEFHYKIRTSFGIGTNITNDVGIKASQIVLKMTKCNGNPVAKISDSPGKMMCTDDAYLHYLAKVFDIDGVWVD